ncbi:glycosyltransferase family 1 protein, partial [bacterium]|nr:glycosyltransferase family 1 protein [bacterium]
MLLNRFAVVSEWYNLQSAENECIMRIKYAASLINKEVVVIANDGEILENFNPTRVYIKNQDIDFVINLHFSSSKGYDGYSYVALWNPLEFYHLFHHYKSTTFNLLSHHDALSCMSDVADDHYTRAIKQYQTLHLPLDLVLSHSNAGPYFSPSAKTRSKIFYCGMNHERKGRKGGRFADIFRTLDAEGILDIYGPKKNWQGFRCYKGLMPFDGLSSFS